MPKPAVSFRTWMYSVVAGSLVWVVSPTLSARAQTTASQFAQEQRDTERHAVRLLERAGVQTEIAALESKWKQRWPALLPSSLEQAHGSLEEMAFLMATETVNGDPRRPRVVQISMPPHDWFGEHVPGGRWGIDNPDTQYFFIPVEADSSYVIRGKRATHGPADANFSFGSVTRWNTLQNISRDQLQIDNDGSYTITLDATPSNGRFNHIQLAPEGNCVIIRNTLGDWNTDSIDRMAVRRVAGPPQDGERTDEVLERELVERLRSTLDRVIDTLQAPVFSLPVNQIPQPGKIADKAGFLSTQRNALGHFRLTADESLVITLQPGGAGYSTIPVTNVWGVTPEYWRHTSSLNNHQALANSDGSFTVVVSSWDPGVANWVDTAGLEEGILMLRWQVLPQKPGLPEPAVHCEMVKRKDLAAALPPTTVRYDREQRESQLKLREAGFARRFTER